VSAQRNSQDGYSPWSSSAARVQRSTPVFQSSALPSAPVVANSPPQGDHATRSTSARCPDTTRTQRPVDTSHTRAVVSSEAVASSRPVVVTVDPPSSPAADTIDEVTEGGAKRAQKCLPVCPRRGSGGAAC
jgi:hypothetical protein